MKVTRSKLLFSKGECVSASLAMLHLNLVIVMVMVMVMMMMIFHLHPICMIIRVTE